MNPRLEKYRVKGESFFASKEGDNFGLFFIKVSTSKIPLKVLSSPLGQGEWDHVSVSLPNRCPTWDEMCLVKELFWMANRTVVQFHPPEKDYVNNHKYCLHLWANNIHEFETPPSILTGVKELGIL